MGQCARFAPCRPPRFWAGPPRYAVLFEGGFPTHSHLSLQDDVYRDKKQNPATIRGYLRDLHDFEKWGLGISTPICNLREIDVAAFLRDQLSRGSSVPARLYHSLVWFEQVFGFNLHTESSLVRAQSSQHLMSHLLHLRRPRWW